MHTYAQTSPLMTGPVYALLSPTVYCCRCGMPLWFRLHVVSLLPIIMSMHLLHSLPLLPMHDFALPLICSWAMTLSPWALRGCSPIAIRLFCARDFAGSLSWLGRRLAAESTVVHEERPENPASAPVTSLYALCLSGGSLHVPEVGLRSGLVTHSEGFLLC